MRVLTNGNIEIIVQLLPDAYAALMAVAERDKLSRTDAINVALVGFNVVSEMADKDGHNLGGAE